MDGQGSLRASGCWWAVFWPKRTRCAGWFGGLAVDCWAASPHGRVERAVGRFSPVGRKDRCEQ
jgi:hypothetical protein